MIAAAAFFAFVAASGLVMLTMIVSDLVRDRRLAVANHRTLELRRERARATSVERPKPSFRTGRFDRHAERDRSTAAPLVR